MPFANWVSSLVGRPATKAASTAKVFDRKQLLREMSGLAHQMNELDVISKIRSQPWAQIEEFVMLRSHFVATIRILREGNEEEINLKLNELQERICLRLANTQREVMALDNVAQLNVSLKCFFGLLCQVVKMN